MQSLRTAEPPGMVHFFLGIARAHGGCMVRSLFLALALIATATNCGGSSEAVVQGGPSAITYEQFLSRVVQEDTGEFIADGDTLFADEAELRDFYNSHVATATDETASAEQGLAIMTSGGKDVRWPSAQQTNLTYCVSTAFGTSYNAVVTAMANATSAWSAVAKVKFVHVVAKDSACTASTTGVVFDVNPVNVNGSYLARAFFPNTARKSRNVKIDNTAFSSSGDPTLTGILRHELGHTLGFRHEHTRPEVGSTCFEDKNWRALTTYDSASVMHYPQCNGTGDWSLTLTRRDAAGAASVYPE